MNISFTKRPAKDNKVQVVVKVFDSRKKIDFRISTGISIKKSDWGKGFPKQSARTTSIRNFLLKLQSDINNFILEERSIKKSDPSEDQLKQYIAVRCNRSKDRTTVSDFIELFIEKKEKELAEKTIQTKKQHLRWLNNITKGMSLSELTKEFIEDVLQPSLLKIEINYDRKYTESKLAEVGTLNNYIKNITSFFNHLYNKQYINKKISQYLKKYNENEKEIIALTRTERSKILSASIKGSNKHQKVLDIFKINCFLGVRYEDLRQVNKSNINNNSISLRLGKTKKLVTIPLGTNCLALIKKYNYSLPIISNQKANDYLKEIFELIGINREVRQTYDIPYNLIDYKVQLSEIASFILARKTFISYALLNNIPIEKVRLLTGHSSDEIYKYLAFKTLELEKIIEKFDNEEKFEEQIYKI